MKQRRSAIKVSLFIIALLPLAAMIYAVMTDTLGPDPAKTLAHLSGEWALRFLLITLSITPLRLLTQSGEWLHYRRMLGLFTFFYAAVHLLVYCLFLLELQWYELWADIIERPYITVGFLALVLMLPLAITSTRGWQRRLGRNWQKLHRLIYIAAGLAILHFIWQIRSDFAEPLVYLLVFLLLMSFRLPQIQAVVKRLR